MDINSPSFMLDEEKKETPSSDALIIDQPDEGVVITFSSPNEYKPEISEDSEEHNANLAEYISDSELDEIACNLLEGIDEDKRSRNEWLQTRANGLKLLGLKLETPRAGSTSSDAPVEGMSTVRHPLLLGAVLNFQATARGELLPADGPVRVRNWSEQTIETEKLSERLERTLNFFLTKTATEFVPDTDRLLFMVGFSGMAFKKVFKCPIRRRPVSECVDAEHLIVTNTAVDIQSAPRVTHEIPMNKVTFKRMELAGIYREVDLSSPDQIQNDFEKAKSRIDGININVTRPEDQVRTIYECYTDLDLPNFEHRKNGKVTGLALPYRVTLEVTSRKILEIRRDWKNNDPDFIRNRTFVPYGFVPCTGFYNIGLLQILGNSTNSLTGIWRLLLDAGMFSNFPGFMVARNGSRQVNTSLRVPPGGGVPIDVTGGMKLTDAIMPLPYKGPDQTLMALAQTIAEQSERLAGMAQMPTADGNKAVPVGTILAAIERADITLNAVHKRLHAAQSLELELIRDLLRDDPEALWRGTGVHDEWNIPQVVAAIDAHAIIPRSDPNIPSHTHRLMKATALAQMAMQAPPGIFNGRAVATRVLNMMHIDDVEALLIPPGQPDQSNQRDQLNAQIKHEANQIKLQTAMATNEIKRQEMESKERQALAKILADRESDRLHIAERLAVHPNSMDEIASVLPRES